MSNTLTRRLITTGAAVLLTAIGFSPYELASTVRAAYVAVSGSGVAANDAPIRSAAATSAGAVS